MKKKVFQLTVSTRVVVCDFDNKSLRIEKSGGKISKQVLYVTYDQWSVLYLGIVCLSTAAVRLIESRK